MEHGEEVLTMLSLAAVFALFLAGVACFVRDGRVNTPRRGLATTEVIDLERMFRLPSRLPRHCEPA
jgi:hypothetical protein